MPSRSDKPSGTTRRGAGRRKTTRASSPSSQEQPAHTSHRRPRGPKSSKPSFDVARDGGPDTRTGGVYESAPGQAETPPVPANPSPVTPASPTRPRVASRSDQPPQRTE